MGVAFADYDNDGNTDIFISNDTYPNLLLHNNGDGTFTDEAATAGVAYNESGKTVAGMGADFRDLSNSGLPDIFHTAMFGDTFPLYKNLGGHQFEDVTTASTLTVATARSTAWGMGIFDFDNDGLKDLFTANSEILDNSMEVQHRPYPLPNSLYRNLGNFKFADVSAAAGLTAPAAHRGAAFGDLFNNGHIDVVTTNLNGPPELLMNVTKSANHWIDVNLVGVQDNRDGLGTRVKITTTHGIQTNQATTAVGYNSSSDKRVHFGLGDATMIDRIDLLWPTGIHQTLTNIKPDQVLTIRESAK